MTWRQANQEVLRIANGLPVYYGTGAPIYKPHVIATTKDAWSGEGMGYNVFVYPEGDGYMPRVHVYSILVNGREEE